MVHISRYKIKFWDGIYNKFGILEFDSHNRFIKDEILIETKDGTFFYDSISFDLNKKTLFIEEV